MKLDLSELERLAKMPPSIEKARFANVLQIDKQILALIECARALEWYADPEHWTIEWVEGSYGDYGQRAREALAKIRGENEN